ncbi:MAG: carbamoyltransferase C-terminal domain-containing protein [Actinomycetota bacterium]
MNILGINSFAHDTAACLLQDGVPVAFVEEERLNRQKHTKEFPDLAIQHCLDRAGITIHDVDVVAFSHKAGVDYRLGAADAIKRLAPKRLAAQTYVDLNLVRKQDAFVRRWNYRGKVANIGHHISHAASAFFASGMDKAAVLTLDRGGDFLSTTMGRGQGTKLLVDKEVRNPDSLGEIYTAVTWFLGFLPNCDEGKVMGLAPYGRDRLATQFRDLVELTDDGAFRVNLEWFAYQREQGFVSDRFLERWGPARKPGTGLSDHHEDIAYAVQDVTEEAGLHITRALSAATGAKNLVLSGGVALNSVMNARLLNETPFEDIFIQAAAGDAGNALGAALYVWHHLMGRPREWTMTHPFLGPEPSDADYRRAIKASGLPWREVKDPAVEAAGMLADSQIIGWFQGRAEVGPRALGARSILADPRKAEMKDFVNARVKHREPFRPFAPAVLHEDGHEYFEDYHLNPFMLLVLPVKGDKRDVIPAVTHVDGTGRLQSVTKDGFGAFHDLISAFKALTGVPVVLNTSFNVMGEPIVNTPEQAINDFKNTGIDALFLGGWITEKSAL